MTADVDMGLWLSAVESHPDTTDTDVAVAIALANGDTARRGVDPEHFDDSTEELIALGFFEDVISIDHGAGHEEHVLEYRLPEGLVQ
jgi:hypothetical protein